MQTQDDLERAAWLSWDMALQKYAEKILHLNMSKREIYTFTPYFTWWARQVVVELVFAKVGNLQRRQMPDLWWQCGKCKLLRSRLFRCRLRAALSGIASRRRAPQLSSLRSGADLPMTKCSQRPSKGCMLL
jgi:hypothetical protein